VTQEILASSYVASGLGEIVDTSSMETVLRFQSPMLMLPKGPEVLLHPGRHTFKLAGLAAGQIVPQLAIRRGGRAANSQYGLNLILVDGSGIDSTNAQAFADAGTLFEQIYAQVGITATALGIGFIHDAALAVLPSAEEYKLAQASVESAPEYPLLPGAINFYFVRQLTSDDAAGTLLGHAMGIPGVPALPNKSGVVLSVDAHRNGMGIDFGAMWITAAHEGGHWHGLRHTSERWGTVQDLVADTPECFPDRDYNKDGFVDMGECAGSGAQNLMFWVYDLTKPPTELTPGQGFVLSSALTVIPQ
jgi:hypothetical protein